MKKPLAFLTVIILSLLLAIPSLAADLVLDASFEDGFSGDSAKLTVTVENATERSMTDVSLDVVVPEGVTQNEGFFALSDLLASEKTSQDVMLTFEAKGTDYTPVFIVGGALLLALVAIALILVRKAKKAKNAAALLLALALLPLAALRSGALIRSWSACRMSLRLMAERTWL